METENVKQKSIIEKVQKDKEHLANTSENEKSQIVEENNRLIKEREELLGDTMTKDAIIENTCKEN